MSRAAGAAGADGRGAVGAGAGDRSGAGAGATCSDAGRLVTSRAPERLIGGVDGLPGAGPAGPSSPVGVTAGSVVGDTSVDGAGSGDVSAAAFLAAAFLVAAAFLAGGGRLLGLHRAAEALPVSLPAGAVGLGVLDGRRMALDAHPEGQAEVECLFVGQSELMSELVDADLLRQRLLLPFLHVVGADTHIRPSILAHHGTGLS